jgi:DNA-binding TFAR19-related protein (PDSD5 family)
VVDRFVWGAGELVPGDEIDEEQVSEAALSEQVSLTEAAGGQAPKGRRFRARLIAGDIQGSSGYYPASMLTQHASVFREGLPVYLDHPGVTEAYERPERSVRDLAGRLASPATYQGDGLYATVEVYPHWAPVIEAMADDIGMSIRATGTVEASTVEGVRGPIVTSLTEAASVDFVTQAGAGGKLVALLESARAAGLAPPFKKKGDEDDAPAEDDETEDDDEDEDEKKKGKLPAFLKAKESSNVGDWLESRIHLMFTSLADDMFGDGRLTRDERLALSSAIGEGLQAFTSRVEADCPHLYQRDPWTDPVKADQAAMTENTTMEGAPMTGSTNKEQAPPDRGTDVTESARERELTTQLAEATQAAETAQAALTEAHAATAARVAALEATLAEAAKQTQRLENDRQARAAVAEALTTSGLHTVSHGRVTESICRDLPTTDDGNLDTARLGEAIKRAITDEATYVATLAEATGAGMPRGLGATDSRELSEADIDKELAGVFAGMGMAESAAVTAAQGRG